MCILFACMSVHHHVCLVLAEAKKRLDPLRLEFQTGESLHVSARNQTQSLGKAASALNY